MPFILFLSYPTETITISLIFTLSSSVQNEYGRVENGRITPQYVYIILSFSFSCFWTCSASCRSFSLLSRSCWLASLALSFKNSLYSSYVSELSGFIRSYHGLCIIYANRIFHHSMLQDIHVPCHSKEGLNHIP